MIRDEEAFGSQSVTATNGRIRSTGSARWGPLLSAEEERELADRIKGGDQAARKQLILANLRVVVEIARGFRSGKVPLDDLIQEGNLGLIRASADFDPTVHGCRFYTYAEVWIRAFIHRSLIANDSLIRVPERVFRQRKQYRRAGNAFGRSGAADDREAVVVAASPEDIAREVGDTPNRIDPDRPARSAYVGNSVVADECEIVPLTDAIIDNDLPDQQVTDQETRLLLEFALCRLNPVEAWVIRERYGICPPMPEVRHRPSPGTDVDHRDDPEFEANMEAHAPGQCRAYFHRSYTELGRDCGLSHHRILQVEETALEKLRDVLSLCLVPS